ncbi:hypothetical protein GCM10023188_48040 [Pontibacter saemangeumensis]|uniref:UspA domain-containing protein n=1 Tax=Pontibacter saemangeumensis TaxID=1084525 RepID=A0ABP8M8B0_9BACT
MDTSNSLQKVLVPIAVDKPAESLLLLSYAGQFAAVFGAGLLLLHSTNTEELTLPEQNRKLSHLRTLGQRVLGRLPTNNTAVPFDCLVRPGKLKDGVKAVVQEAGVDLVLMQAEAYPEAGKVGAANNAAGVMEQVSCPVMVVPTAQPFKRMKHLVFATDFTDSDPKVLAQIKHFADQAGAAMSLVQVYSAAERGQLNQMKEAKAGIEKQLGGRKVSLQLLEAEDTLEGISSFAEREQADLVVLATQDSYLMQRLFSEAYIEMKAYHTHIPLLTYRQHKSKPCSGCCTACKKAKQEHQETTPLQLPLL